MQVPQLRAVISESSAKWSEPYVRATKSGCIDILINHDTPFPECPCIQWNFLLKCTYEGYDKEKFESIRSQDLKYEARRLGISRPARPRNEIIDILLQFIKNKGVGHLAAINVTDRGCFHWKSPSVVPGKHGQRNDITVPIRPCFDITTTNPVLVIIIARNSTFHRPPLKLQKEEERQFLMDQVELILRRKDVIKGIKEAEYKHFDADGCRLTYSIPISLIGVMRDDWKFDFVSSLEQASPGTKVLIVASGVDGLPTDLSGWTLFHGKFQTRRGLDITIVFSETSDQWHKADIAWRGGDWMGPVSDRFWALCPLEDLINTQQDTPLASNIREQWERCRDGRFSYSQASVVQQRPVRGRNSLPRGS